MLNPHYITGFVDGEGCFSVSISQKRFRVPEVRLKFEIELREDDEPILKEIQKVLQCGSIYHLEYEKYKKWQPHVKYMVGSFKDIRDKVIPFFQRYPLQAKKKKQFEFFCKVAKMMENNEHRTFEGIELISTLRESLRQHRDSLDAGDPHVQWGAE